MVVCLERGADLHIAQLMPLPLTVSWFSKTQTDFTFLVPADPGSPRKIAMFSLCWVLAAHPKGTSSKSRQGQVFVNRCRCGVQQAKKVSIEGVKRPRGRPPLPETLKRRMQEERLSQSAAETAKQPSNVDRLPAARAPASPVPEPPTAAESPEEPPAPVVKKRRKQGPRGMARLFVNRPGSKVNGSAKQQRPAAAEVSRPNHHETENESPKAARAVERPVEAAAAAADQIIPSLSSPIWQPASKRVLDAVCVTDVTAGSGVTITVRESSIVDGFFRSRPE